MSIVMNTTIMKTTGTTAGVNQQPRAASHHEDPTRASRVCRVLIADDHLDFADSLALLLQLEGHFVTVVNDGEAAVVAIEEARPDVALLDVRTPRFDGYEVARRVRTLLKDTIVLVAITGRGQQIDKAHAFSAGFDHHFTKPVEPAVVTTLLRQISATDRGRA